MHAPERLHAWRVVAEPSALDAAPWPALALRIAPDDVLLLDTPIAPTVADEHAIVEPDAGWCALTMTEAEFTRGPAHHVEWRLPTMRPALAQGLLASVPVKLWFPGNGTVSLIFLACYENDLMERLG